MRSANGAIDFLREQRRTAKQSDVEIDVSQRPVCHVLKRLGVNRIWAMEPHETPVAKSASIPAS